MRTLHTRVSNFDYSLLKALASISGLPMNSYVNEALQNYLYDILDNPEFGPNVLHLAESYEIIG